MLDATLRPRLAPLLDRVGSSLGRRGVSPLAVTVAGLVTGLGAAVAAGTARWSVALGLWLVSRLMDGLDGPVARARGRVTAFGGWADIVADLAVYGAFVVGCAFGQPDAWPALLVLLLTYYVNAGSLLAYSAAAERARLQAPDDRTFHFSRGLAEGTETIVAHGLFVLFPSAMAPLAWTFAAMVVITIGQRALLARRLLG